MAEDGKRTNPFLSYVEPNAIVPPETYEKCALYGLLYTSIANDLIDQGFTDAMTLNVMVTDRVKQYVSIMEKILNGMPLSPKELESEKNVRDYMKLYVPIDNPFNDDGSVNIATRDANLAYIRDFKKQYTRVVGEMGKIIAYAKANGIQLEHGMLTRDQTELLLLAKREKCREFYDLVRGNCDGKPGKIDKKDGSSKEGVHLKLYREGKNQLLKKKHTIAKEGRKNALKVVGSVALWGLCAASVVFSAGALSPTLASLVGSSFSAAGIGQFFTGAITGFISFRSGIKVTKLASDGIKANYKRRQELKEFIGPRITKERMDALLANYGKEGKDLTFNERKALLMFDKAAKMYFEKGKVEGEFDGEQLSKYLPQEIIDQYKFAEDARRFRLVSDKGNLYDRMFLKLPNEPTELVGDGELGRSDVRSVYNNAVKSTDLKTIDDAIVRIDLGQKKIGDVNHHTYMQNLGKQLTFAFDNAIFEEPHTSTSYGTILDKFGQERIKKAIKTAGIDNSETIIENSLKFYETVKDGTDSPLSSSVGVGVRSQLVFDAPSVVAGCKSLEDASAAVVGPTVNKILALKQLDDDEIVTDTTVTPPVSRYVVHDTLGDLQSEIDSLGVSNKVKDYLHFMLNKKTKTVTASATRTAKSLANSSGVVTTGAATVASYIDGLSISGGQIVGSVTGGESVDKIKEYIFSLPDTELPADKKKEAQTLLMIKVAAIEQAERTKAYDKAAKLFTTASGEKPISFVGIEGKISKIDMAALESGTVDGVSMLTFFRDKIKKGSLSDYSIQLFQNKVYDTLNSEMQHDKYTSSSDGLNNLIGLIKKVNQCQKNGYLSEGQAMRIIADLEPKLIDRLNAKLADLKKDFFKSSSDPSTASNLAYQLLRNGYGDATPGLKEYFAMNTTTSNALKANVYYMQTLNNVYEMVKRNGSPYGGLEVKMNENEALSFAEVYFSKPVRDAAGSTPDELIGFLAKMQKASTDHTADKFNVNPTALDDTNNTTYGDEYLRDVHAILDGIQTSGMSPKEKYAALVVAKARCVAMYKSYLRKTIEDCGLDTFTSMSHASAMAYLQDRVLNRGWGTMFARIENDYAALGLPHDYKFNSITTQIGQTVTRDKAYGYASSPEMQP